MKIAIVSGTFFPHPGGAQVQVHNLANKLKLNNINVDCYLFDKTNLTNNNYSIIIFNKLLLNVVFLLKYYLNIKIFYFLKIYLKHIIKSKNYDLWHFNFLNYKSLILIETLKELNQKILVTFQGVDVQINKKINYGYRIDNKYDRYLKKIIKKVNIFSCLSKTIYKDLILLGASENKICFIPNSVEIEKFDYKKKEINPKLYLITVARYAEKKKRI